MKFLLSFSSVTVVLCEVFAIILKIFVIFENSEILLKTKPLKLVKEEQQRSRTDLHFLLPQMDLAGQLLAGPDVGVLGLLEEALQSLQLLVGEDGSVPPLPATVQLVEELQLGACETAHVHVGHHLMRDGGQEHRAGAVEPCGSGDSGWRVNRRSQTSKKSSSASFLYMEKKARLS